MITPAFLEFTSRGIPHVVGGVATCGRCNDSATRVTIIFDHVPEYLLSLATILVRWLYEIEFCIFASSTLGTRQKLWYSAHAMILATEYSGVFGRTRSAQFLSAIFSRPESN